MHYGWVFLSLQCCIFLPLFNHRLPLRHRKCNYPRKSVRHWVMPPRKIWLALRAQINPFIFPPCCSLGQQCLDAMLREKPFPVKTEEKGRGHWKVSSPLGSFDYRVFDWSVTRVMWVGGFSVQLLWEHRTVFLSTSRSMSHPLKRSASCDLRESLK